MRRCSWCNQRMILGALTSPGATMHDRCLRIVERITGENEAQAERALAQFRLRSEEEDRA